MKKQEVEKILEEFAAMIIGNGHGTFDGFVNRICELDKVEQCARCGRPLIVPQHLDYANMPEGKVCMICLGGS